MTNSKPDNEPIRVNLPALPDNSEDRFASIISAVAHAANECGREGKQVVGILIDNTKGPREITLEVEGA